MFEFACAVWVGLGVIGVGVLGGKIEEGIPRSQRIAIVLWCGVLIALGPLFLYWTIGDAAGPVQFSFGDRIKLRGDHPLNGRRGTYIEKLNDRYNAHLVAIDAPCDKPNQEPTQVVVRRDQIKGSWR